MNATVDWGRFSREAYSRNSGILTEQDQAGLREWRVLVAGCGSVGGAVVEPLVRLGVQSLVLADPDVYALHNLNRQACVLEEIGEPKPSVLARRAAAINPYATIAAVEEGVTPENVDRLVAAADVVFDGVDIGTSSALWAKYLVHDRAAARGLPVLSGVDLGGQPTVLVWDYRRDPRPFYGKSRIAAFRQGRELEAALRFVGLTRLPRDFIGVIMGRAATGMPWPQITYAADGIGVLASRAIIDLLMNRPVADVVSVDVHMRSRRRLHRLVERARWPRAALGLMQSISSAPAPPERRSEARVSETICRAVEAIRWAPSALNSQPWLIEVAGPSGLLLCRNQQRELGAIDPDRTRTGIGMGCAAEAASFALGGEVEVTEANGSIHLSVPEAGLPPRLLRERAARLRLRYTNRLPYLRDGVASEVLAAIADRIVERGVDLEVLDTPFAVQGAARGVAGVLSEAMRADLWWHDYLKWIRVSPRDHDWDDDGVDVRALGLRWGKPLFATLKRERLWRRGRLQLNRLLAEERAQTIEQSAAIFALSVDDPDRFAAQLAIGRALMAGWMAATELGIAAEPLPDISAPAAGTGSPVTARIRFGYPSQTAVGRRARLATARIVADA